MDEQGASPTWPTCSATTARGPRGACPRTRPSSRACATSSVRSCCGSAAPTAGSRPTRSSAWRRASSSCTATSPTSCPSPMSTPWPSSSTPSRRWRVRHIIVCGHYGCGGVRAALEGHQAGAVALWLQPLRNLADEHRAELDGLPSGSGAPGPALRAQRGRAGPRRRAVGDRRVGVGARRAARRPRVDLRPSGRAASRPRRHHRRRLSVPRHPARRWPPAWTSCTS